ncbi:MAG: hypothetical protein P8X57_07170 [Cyclobacteriaceae bacterium]
MKTTLAILIMVLLVGPASIAQEIVEHKKHRGGTHTHFDIDLGLNNWLEDGNNPSGTNYEVKPWGSWYIAFKSINDTHVGGKFHLQWGPDVSFYSFKFQNEQTRVIKTDDEVLFLTEDLISSRKSKLEVIYLGFSTVPMLQFGERHGHGHWHHGDFAFGNNSGGFRIGIGAYGGYRLGSKTKYVTDENGGKDKEKDHDNFYLQNWRYGLRMQAGFRGVDFFFNYDLNEIFTDGRGPALNAISFGVTL